MGPVAALIATVSHRRVALPVPPARAVYAKTTLGYVPSHMTCDKVRQTT
jgi:hypothetical protein